MQDLYMSTIKDCEDREARGTSNGCALETVRENAEDWGLTRPMIGYVLTLSLGDEASQPLSVLSSFLGGVLVEAGSGEELYLPLSITILLTRWPTTQTRPL